MLLLGGREGTDLDVTVDDRVLVKKLEARGDVHGTAREVLERRRRRGSEGVEPVTQSALVLRHKQTEVLADVRVEEVADDVGVRGKLAEDLDLTLKGGQVHLVGLIRGELLHGALPAINETAVNRSRRSAFAQWLADLNRVDVDVERASRSHRSQGHRGLLIALALAWWTLAGRVERR